MGLVESYLAGDPEAIARIDRWIERAAFPYRRRLAHHWDDLLQEIRLEIYTLLGKGRFREEASLKTYLWRVINHTCLDQVRALGRRPSSSLEDAPESTWESPPRAGIAHETTDLVLRVLAEVPEACRRLWGMIHAGLSYREMSRRVGDSEGALRVRVLRCRKKAVEIRDRLLGENLA